MSSSLSPVKVPDVVRDYHLKEAFGPDPTPDAVRNYHLKQAGGLNALPAAVGNHQQNRSICHYHTAACGGEKSVSFSQALDTREGGRLNRPTCPHPPADGGETQHGSPKPDALNQLVELIRRAIGQWLEGLLNPGAQNATNPPQSSPSATNSLAPPPGSLKVLGARGEGSNSGQSRQANAVGASAGEVHASDSGQLHLPEQLKPYRDDILHAASVTGMPPSIIAGQIWAESRGNLASASTNVNGKTDSGLMQVNAATFAGLKKANPELLGGADLAKPRDNILAGAIYLRDGNRAFDGNMGAALRAYNSGPDKVNVHNLADTGGVGGASYPADVLKFAQMISSGQGQLPA
ncbi:MULTISPECIES: transglycosylase SLT domain-containing protein [Pseudomonas]|uniref:Transglycosylase SLT domain-containing protein n=1 Tax=Pseudomonas wuhanensis TaxID=2954098 RepID=A0ABY9GLD3_9PSED|nr:MULTISPECIES: transglycosylase SLT domain-containing protein [unclassified Pseudomonas]WLI10680.1 transglycosylase SLT domain-containing protein [Pseudomonas sp. FP603]WLI16496.1 transglycosylase SLT domain-containing protein [Pseudomonas sp. FP607]